MKQLIRRVYFTVLILFTLIPGLIVQGIVWEFSGKECGAINKYFNWLEHKSREL